MAKCEWKQILPGFKFYFETFGLVLQSLNFLFTPCNYHPLLAAFLLFFSSLNLRTLYNLNLLFMYISLRYLTPPLSASVFLSSTELRLAQGITFRWVSNHVKFEPDWYGTLLVWEITEKAEMSHMPFAMTGRWNHCHWNFLLLALRCRKRRGIEEDISFYS